MKPPTPSVFILSFGHPILRPSALREQKHVGFYGHNVPHAVLLKQMDNERLLSGSDQRVYVCSGCVE